ncbi:MAG: hypothetical protein IH945_08045 [Armatimonadetes bacterium]|nr:hypothetical protein [Armatimonadota bacterium]
MSVCLAVFAALLIQQEQTVTFAHPCANSVVVLKALGKELNLTLKPSGSVNKEYFLVSFDEVPVQQALDMVAETLDARWMIIGGTYYLQRTSAHIAEAKRTRAELLQAGVEEYLDEKARRATNWSRQRATEALRPLLRNDGSLDKELARIELSAAGPCRELVDEFVRAIGAKRLSKIPEGSPVVYRWSPKQGEQRIPASLRAKAQNLVGNITSFSAALQGLGVPALGDFDLPAEVRLAGARGLTPDAWSFRVQNFGRYLYVVMIASGSNPSPYGSVSISAKGREVAEAVIPGLEGVYEADPLASAIVKRLRQASTDSAHRLRDDDEMSAEIMEWFESGLSPDPTHLMAGDAVLQIAEAAGYSVVALLQDGVYSGFVVRSYDDKPLVEVLDVFGRSMDVSIDEESRTITIRPVPIPLGHWHFDREAVAKLALQAYEDGWARIEPLAIYAMSCDGDVPWQWGRQITAVLQPVRHGPMQSMDKSAHRAFKIYGSLPKAARKMAHDDWLSFPVADLPRNVRELVYEAYTNRTFASAHSSSTDYRWTRWPTIVLSSVPVENAADLEGAFLDVRVEQAQLLAARDHKEGNLVSSGGLMTPEEAAARIHNALQEGQSGKIDFTTLGELTAERLILRLRTRSSGYFIVILTVDSSNSETIYLPHAQISSILGKELKRELARLGIEQMTAPKEERSK